MPEAASRRAMALRLLAGAIAAAIATTARAEAREDVGRDPSFVVMPIPVSNPAIGNGVAAVGLALYRAGGSERPWATGVGGLYTDSESWFVAAGQKAYLGRDRFRLTAGAGVGVFNVDFFGIGQDAGSRGRSIPIEESAKGGLVEGLMRLGANLYGGFEYRLVDMDVTFDLSQLPFPDLEIPAVQRQSRTSAFGLAGEYDTRDNEYGPSRGLYATATWLRAAEALGGDFDYSRAEAAVNGYHRLDSASVLAWRVATCSSGDGAPFYDLCSYGSTSDLRGYVAGQYIDHAMYAVQAEYRRHLFWRIGGTVFAGFGGVDESFGKMSTVDLLPAAGLGLRFKASQKYGVNARIDFAWGKGSHAAYFAIGEAF